MVNALRILKFVVASCVIAAMAMLPGLMLGCSVYRVSHEERPREDGTVGYATTLYKLVPPGGKDISEGSARIGIDADGNWAMQLGQTSETDMTGTAALIQGLVNTLVTQSAENGQLHAHNQALASQLQRMQRQLDALDQRIERHD